MHTPLESLIRWTMDMMRADPMFSHAYEARPTPIFGEYLELLLTNNHLRSMVLALLLHDANSAVPHRSLFLSTGGYLAIMQILAQELAGGFLTRAYELRHLDRKSTRLNSSHT